VNSAPRPAAVRTLVSPYVVVQVANHATGRSERENATRNRVDPLQSTALSHDPSSSTRARLV